jgi:hypothetical protein
MKEYRGRRHTAPLFNFDTTEVKGQLHATAALTPGKNPSTHCLGGWVGSRAGLDGCRKSHTMGIHPPTVQSVSSRFADWAIAVNAMLILRLISGTRVQVTVDVTKERKTDLSLE